ncbi:uncharacterized protein METZ01_LOCUS218118 [marine metagenome]|uniref:Uncharacterized protein n=1 Tax=marine metagenome TaxID=408172 RepID=A0A382FSC2_9ZZZZ
MTLTFWSGPAGIVFSSRLFVLQGQNNIDEAGGIVVNLPGGFERGFESAVWLNT